MESSHPRPSQRLQSVTRSVIRVLLQGEASPPQIRTARLVCLNHLQTPRLRYVFRGALSPTARNVHVVVCNYGFHGRPLLVDKNHSSMKRPHLQLTVSELQLTPIEKIPDSLKDGRPILAYFNGNRPPEDRFCVMYFDSSVGLWYTKPGRRYTGTPTHFAELLPPYIR